MGALVDQMTLSCFWVTAWHEHVGGIVPYTQLPDGAQFCVRKTVPPQECADLQSYIGSLCLSSATGPRNPMYMSDWKFLLPDNRAKVLHAMLMQDLEELSENL